jgi:HrpA-like RNA helicase
VFVSGREDVDALQDLLNLDPSFNGYKQRNLGYELAVKKAFGGRDTIDMSDFDPPNSGRQVILPTTAAETSITIEDIDIVIDTGATNVNWYRHQDRTQQLSTMVVSQSRAIQRVGRAGRKRPGVGPKYFPGIFHPRLFIEYLLC